MKVGEEGIYYRDITAARNQEPVSGLILRVSVKPIPINHDMIEGVATRSRFDQSPYEGSAVHGARDLQTRSNPVMRSTLSYR